MAALFSGANFLGISPIGGLPLGNVIAALALASPASFAVLLSTPDSASRIVALTVLLAALAWFRFPLH